MRSFILAALGTLVAGILLLVIEYKYLHKGDA